MAYKPRDERPGYHHVVTRGNNRRTIFRADPDRRFFFDHVGRLAKKYGWTIVAYCLMDNHYHLVVETPLPNLPSGMRQLNGLYAQWFNRRYERSGHLFQARLHPLHVVVQQARFVDGSRKITQIAEVVGIEEDGQVRMENIFEFSRLSGARGEVVGEFRATGYMPSFLNEFITMGLCPDGNFL